MPAKFKVDEKVIYVRPGYPYRTTYIAEVKPGNNLEKYFYGTCDHDHWVHEGWLTKFPANAGIGITEFMKRW